MSLSSATSSESRAHGRPVVVFLARNLLVGGAERTFVNFVNMATDCVPVVALLERRGALLEELRPDVPVFELARRVPGEASGLRRSVSTSGFVQFLHLFGEARRLRRVVEETGGQVVSSFLMRSHVVAAIAKLFLRMDARIVINVHEHMSQSAPYLYPTRIDLWLMRLITTRWFPRADAIVVVAETVGDDLVQHFGVPRANIRVINNPIDIEEVRALAKEPASYPKDLKRDGAMIIAVGRLVPLKGYEYLIRAVADLETSLVIVGRGEERDALEALIEELGVPDRVALLGYQSNPWRFMSDADALVLSSLTEAFPNVIGEALALGVPIVATDCSPGVSEYLGDGEWGVLVAPGDVDAIKDGIRRVLDDDGLRHRLRSRSGRRVLQFGARSIVTRYEAELRSVAGLPVRPTARPGDV